MSKTLHVYGPYEIPFRVIHGNVKNIDRDPHVEKFWNGIKSDNSSKKLLNKQGCYVFAIRAGKGFNPWYIGKTTKRFKDECFQPHKLEHYNTVLNHGITGSPVMFFVAPEGNSKKVGKKDLDDIETTLIQYGKLKNDKIRNSRKTSLPDWSIAGVIRGHKGESGTISAKFRKMLGI